MHCGCLLVLRPCALCSWSAVEYLLLSTFLWCFGVVVVVAVGGSAFLVAGRCSSFPQCLWPSGPVRVRVSVRVSVSVFSFGFVMCLWGFRVAAGVFGAPVVGWWPLGGSCLRGVLNFIVCSCSCGFLFVNLFISLFCALGLLGLLGLLGCLPSGTGGRSSAAAPHSPSACVLLLRQGYMPT